MAEELKKQDRENAEKKQEAREIIRMLSVDIPGDRNVYTGLTRIKGVSWGLSNAVCKILKIDKEKKIGTLNEEEIKRISEFIKSPKLPRFLLNRRNDIEEGIDSHRIGTDLEMTKEFDIKRLKKMKCYKGVRHSQGQPVRGQKTRSHFRKNKIGGIMKKLKKAKEAK
ncbi:30S ribosomal protein S13 [Candidatus Pacearchaeota archaeon]|nr:30S ribosomal protein S13 [Candidatus Pacearchaeota archaeon]